MRMGTWGRPLQGHTGRIRSKSRLKGDRKARLTLIDLEGLESRTLLATIPAAAATGAAVNLTGLGSVTSNGNANNPMVVVNPYDSQKVFAVWGVDLSQVVPAVTPTTAIVEGAYSSNGGTSWNNLGERVNPPILDVATITSTNPTAYAQVTDPSVAFDGKGNVYVLALQTTGAGDGALTMTEFNFSGGTPAQVSLPNNGIIYQWVSGSDGVTTPVLAVDQAPPDSSDPYANDVYIAWASTDIEPADTLPYTGPGFNPNRAELVVGTPISSPLVPNERSIAFSGATTVNVSSGQSPQGVNFGPAQQSTHPQLVINQNATGEVTVAWDNASNATGALSSPPTDTLNSNLVQAGNTYGFSGVTGPYQPAGAQSAGNWASAVIYNTGPQGSTLDPVSIAVGDVNGKSGADLIVTNQGTNQIGELLNQGAGVYPTAGATDFAAGNNPFDVVLGNFVSGHTSSAILDAAVANNTATGGVSILPNGVALTDGTGIFLPPKQPPLVLPPERARSPSNRAISMAADYPRSSR